MPDHYDNYAFISYSHKDEKWAAWIQRKLEAYRLPSVIRKEAGSTVPERIRPVFRDATDLGAGRLRDNLQQELESSRFLVVVCSPNSAKPNAEGKHWVNDEVTHFASLGRADRIVPVLIEGDEKTALCPKLRELGILAVDATKKSRARTLNDIVAALLGLRPDELWLREERIRRRKRLWRGLAAAAALLLAAAGAWRWYDIAATHVEYYSDWVDEWGIPTGIPDACLTKDQVRNRLFSYRFEFKGRQKDGGLFAPRVLRRVVMQDADGRTLNDDTVFFSEDAYHLDRPRIQVLHYREDGHLEYIDDRDGKELPIVRHKFSGRDNTDVEHVRIVGGTEIDSPVLAAGNSFGNPEDVADRTEIRRFTHTRDAQGLIVKTLYKKDRGTKARDAEGVYGIAFQRDPTGRPVKETYLGYNGSPHANRAGTAGLVRTFSDSGFLVRGSFVDEYGKSKLNGNYGYAQLAYERDTFGNAVRTGSLDASGLPVLLSNGTAGVWMTAKNGRLTSKMFLDNEGNQTPCIDGYVTTSLDWKDDGNLLSIRFLDGQQRLCQTSSGFAEERWTFKDGDIVLVERFDEHGKLAMDKDGQAGWHSEWKSHQEIKRVYFDSDRKPAFSPEFGAGFSAEYNEDGQITSWYFLDEFEHATDGSDGWAGRLTEYEDGQPVRVRFVDKEGNLVLVPGGTAGWNSVFENGNLSEWTFIGEDGSPTLCDNGFATSKNTYKNGLLVSYRFFGLDGEPVLHRDGNAGANYRYDDAGRVTEYTWFGVSGEPVRCRETGAIGYRSKYDAAGNEIEHWWIGPDGKPCRHVDGNAGWKAKYDAQNREIERIYVDVGGNPTILPKDGTAGGRFEYDERGNVTSLSYIGIDGNETACFDGYSKEKSEYNAFGNETCHMFFETNGRLIAVQNWQGTAGWNSEYDRFQRVTKVTYFGTNGLPNVAGKGFASKETFWDNLGRKTGERFYDAEGNLTILPETLIAGMDDEYDTLGNRTRRTFIGTDGKPCRHFEGNAGWRAKHDRRGNCTEFVYVDENDVPMPLNTDGIAGHRSEYDKNNNEIRHVNLDTNENPKKNFDGWAQWTRKYDERGNETEVRYFDEHETPCLLTNWGYSGWKIKRDGNESTTIYLDVSGNPTRTKDGWSGTRETLDDYGNVANLVYLDLDGSRFGDGRGCAEIVSAFNETGFRTNVVYLGVDGRPVPVGDNHVCGEMSWINEFGKETMRIHLGPNGTPGVNDAGAIGDAFSFDRFGRQTGWFAFDKDDKPVLYPSLGYAEIAYEFNEDGSSSTYYLDANEEITLTTDGVASERSCYDDNGREILHLFYGLDGKRCSALSSGVSGWESDWDERGNEVRRTWIGTDGEPEPHRNGNASWEAEYDERGRNVGQRFFDANGNPAFFADGTVGIAWEYDDAGNIIKTMNLGKDGKLIEDTSGWAIQGNDYDLFGRVVEVRWRGVDGKPVLEIDTGCAGYRDALDIFGNVTNRIFFGLDGKPKPHKDGNVGFAQTFERGLCTSVRYFGTNGEAITIPAGYAGYDNRYDGFGRMVEQWYLGPEGQPCTDTNGCARMRWAYDERGLCTEFEELDLGGNLFTNAVHAATKTVFEYDTRGHETIRRFVDANGTLLAGPKGFAARAVVCDFAGRETEVRYLDEKEQPVRNRENNAAVERREWDGRGNLVAVRYFDENDAPCVCSNGYASVETEYDIRGRSTKTLHYGPDGELVALPESGCAGWTSERDRLGNESKRTWIGTDGNPVSDKNGVYGWTSVFKRGKETSRRWIGADGEPCRAADGTFGWDKTYDEYGNELTKNEVR